MINSTAANAREANDERWRLVIHGGAGTMSRDRLTPEQDKEIRDALGRALDAGSAVLAGGGSALDAVTESVEVLEDDPNFNAGRGAVLTYDGEIELDASVMDGRTRSAGAVAGVSTTKNPVLLARRVMEESPHVFLSRKGADRFAVEQGLEQVDPPYFETPERRRQWQEFRARKVGYFDVDMKYGTVGAVAIDMEGHVAAATSTGGLTGKRWGRIGDSPVIGAGTYADDRACAVSATGSGEFFIRIGVAHEICARVRLKGESLQQAADAVIAELTEMGGIGGVIVTGPSGEMIWSFNSPGMYRGRVSSSQTKQIAIFGDE
ncbi:isoaspartyl peptidase/L-asparaginase family protein [Rhizorhapis suberifaciens]|uniref:Isoaspartyl peptidase n=1 Tax=Rhizorhapis suberifaciens TaxID=13656 RepID=A0A840HVW8_9SPHN|nr:isoaspartyl peptidase/L-asparaginase [Rhizorhapis suberifaciens]MBB4641767.1 beta-aspartyl-peptidase (threonine type) [Rhizorhapis suberifaciens]